MAANILVVEDELAIQELLALNLEHAGYYVLKAADAEAALSLLNSALPDLLLVDWMLPKMSGVALTRKLRSEARTREVPIIMLTGKAEEQDRILGLEAGADDYVTKPFSPREVLARIKALLRRRAPQSTDEVVQAAGLQLDPATRRVIANNRPIALGPTEFRLLHFLMTHPARVHTRAQLLDQVWGDHVFIEERTVDVHVRRLRRVLEQTGHDKNIETVRGSGYRFSPELGVPQ